MNMYNDGTYLKNNPQWHAEDAPWKAKWVEHILQKSKIDFDTICEVGCGTGEVLYQLSRRIGANKRYIGYEISAAAMELSRKVENRAIELNLGDAFTSGVKYDIAMALDIVEHVENPFEFLRKLKGLGTYKVLHIPLDMSVQMVLRMRPIMRVRRQVGHLHYFSKETALETLSDSGLRILDYNYTGSMLELPGKSVSTKIMNIPRRMLYPIHNDAAVRILGGYSLMILCE